jgi:hypothetical protein
VTVPPLYGGAWPGQTRKNQPTPKMTPGRYIMRWCGSTSTVEVRMICGELHFVPESGWAHPIRTVPDAKWERIS